MDIEDLANRFDYHRPDARGQQHLEQVRARCRSLALELNDLIPEGREKALAITNLEQAMFWANAAIARQGLSRVPYLAFDARMDNRDEADTRPDAPAIA